MADTVHLQDYWNTRDKWTFNPATRVLTFPLPDLTSSRQILVRASYEALWDELQKLPPPTLDRVWPQVVVGTPGIGKSMYLAYVAYRLLQQDPGIVIVFHDYLDLYRLDSGGVAVTDRHDPVLKQQTTWYLADAVVAVDARCRIVVVTSPQRDILRRVVKAGGIKFYMPPWSWEEIDAARQLIFRHIDIGEAQSRYQRWGGVPRYVLQLATVPFNDTELDGAIDTVAPRAAELMLRVGSDGGDEEHVFHLVPRQGYTDYTVACASAYVADRLVDAAVRYHRWNLTNFLATSADQGRVAAARSMLFESWAHGRLCEGVTVRVRDLATEAESTWTLPPLQVSTRPSLAGPPVAANQYVRPAHKTEPAVDAAARCDVGVGAGEEVLLLLLTVSTEQPVTTQAVLHAQRWAAAAGVPCRRLVFVVPPDVFHGAGRDQRGIRQQQYKNVDGIDTADRAAPRIEQWALEMPLSPTDVVAAAMPVAPVAGAAGGARKRAAVAAAVASGPAVDGPGGGRP